MRKGIPITPVEKIEKVKRGDKATGTTTTFKFDETIFKEEAEFRFDTLMNRFREMAFVTRGVFITLRDERPSCPPRDEFLF